MIYRNWILLILMTDISNNFAVKYGLCYESCDRLFYLYKCTQLQSYNTVHKCYISSTCMHGNRTVHVYSCHWIYELLYSVG